MTAAIFWLCASLVAYVYIGYPALLVVWSRLRHRQQARRADPRRWPSISIVIAARNEARFLPDRIENLLELDYPGPRQIIVVSDGSTDDTTGALEPYRAVVDLVAAKSHGKAAALNLGVEHARHELLVFTDARQAFAVDALTELARPFGDPEIGAVSGELLLEDGDPASAADHRSAGGGSASVTTVGDSMGLYWRLEKRIRELESDIGSMIGVTGAIYAMRRALWTALPAGTILDDVLAPMRCVLNHHRVVFNRRARAFDRFSPDALAEARRKRRTHAGNYQLLSLEPRLLAPWRNPVWVQYVSHKLGRLIVPYALVGLVVSNAALASRSAFYAVALAAQCGFYLLAAAGAWIELADRIGQASSLSWRRSAS